MGERLGIVTGREYRKTRPRGYASWNPQGPTRDLIAKVQGIIDEYAQPLTLPDITHSPSISARRTGATGGLFECGLTTGADRSFGRERGCPNQPIPL